VEGHDKVSLVVENENEEESLVCVKELASLASKIILALGNVQGTDQF